MMSKLPPELRIQVTRKTASELWEINDILEIIRKELEAREIIDSVRRSNDELRRPNESWNPAYLLKMANMNERLNSYPSFSIQ